MKAPPLPLTPLSTRSFIARRRASLDGRHAATLTSLLLALALPACGGKGSSGSGGGTSTSSATTGSSTTGSGAGGGGSEVPLIGEVLDCGKAGTAGSLAPGKNASQLLRHDLDLTAFPDALCNDGSPAIFYYRPASDPADADKWIIQLQGGGSCQSGDECAGRWCNEGTAFSLVGMSSAPAPKQSIDGHGILGRSADDPALGPNPTGSYNQVFVKYCSSDAWLGTARDVVLDGHHPLTQAGVTYRTHFLGRRIVEATLATLRQDGVAALSYDGQTMPDLDDAKVVVFGGASAGGAGTIHGGDHVEELLRAANPGLEEYRLIIDSIFAPELMTRVGFEQTDSCAQGGICTPQQFLTAGEAAQDAAWKPQRDQSCLDAHPGESWRCADSAHVLLNHITSPMLVRMGLTDELISDPFVTGGLSNEKGKPYDLQMFGLVVRSQLLALGDLKTTAEEGAKIAVTPAAFGPVCSKHETLRSDPDTFGVTIDPGTGATAMFDVWDDWRAGNAKQLVTSSVGDTVCPK